MTFCEFDGYKFNGTINEEGEFTVGSFYHFPAINQSIEGLFIIPPICLINGNEYKITNISAYSFYDTKFTEIIVPSTVKILNAAAFEHSSNLVSVDLSALQISIIPRYCFSMCFKLETVILPPLITTIEICAFYECKSLQYLKLPFSFKEFEENVFQKSTLFTTIIFCGVYDINQLLPDTVTDIYVSQYYKDEQFCFKQIHKKHSLCIIPPQTCLKKEKQININPFICIIIFVCIYYTK